MVHRIREHGTKGMRWYSPHNPNRGGDYKPGGKSLPTGQIESFQDGEQNMGPNKRMGRIQKEICGTRHRQEAAGGTERNDPKRTAIWRGGLRLEDAVSQCSNICTQGSSGSSSGIGIQWPEISRLHGLFNIWSHFVERWDCSTPDGYLTKARQLSQPTSNCQRGVALGQILPHIQKDRITGMVDLSAGWQCLNAAYADPNSVGTNKSMMQANKQKNHEFSQDYG